jgi:hypothetical protein
MSPGNFTIWLNGFLAMRDGLTEDEIDYVRRALGSVEPEEITFTVEREEASDLEKDIVASLDAMTAEDWDWINNKIPYCQQGYRWRDIMISLRELTKIDSED